MTVIIDDKFTGETVTVDLDAHTPDTVGTGWTIIEQTGARDIRIRGDLSENHASGEAENSDRALYTAQGSYTINDYDIEITILTIDSADDLAWIMGRVTDSSNYYAAGFVSVAGTDLFLVKNVATTVTTLSSADTDLIVNNAVIKLEIRNAAKKVFIDNVEKLTDPDDILTSIGEAGLALGNIRNSTDDLGAQWDLDNFLVTDTVVPSGRIMASLAGAGGLAGYGGIAGQGGGLAG